MLCAPPSAFKDMWATLQQGFPWTALVKNRRSNGDHYWVRANVVPIIRGGKTKGYLSVRTKPTTAEINATQALYDKMNRGELNNRRLHRGLFNPYRHYPQFFYFKNTFCALADPQRFAGFTRP